MDIPRFTERIAKERNCTPELVRAIVGDCLAALHESTGEAWHRDRIGRSLLGIGGLSAWHFGGILASAAERDPGELIEHYQRLDPTMKRFRQILDQWECELKIERGEDESSA
jgi:hypothetical protein